MTDLDLLVLGCIVSFVAAAGAYVFVREQMVPGLTKHAEDSDSARSKEDGERGSQRVA